MFRRWSQLPSLALATGLVAGGLASLAPQTADAFCGFYVAGADSELFNDATVVVLMRDGTRTVLSMQNDYQGPPEAFAMVIPVPVVLSEDDVKTLRPELFERVETLASPRLVEYWEQDPCEPSPWGLIGKGGGGGSGSGYGRGAGAGFGGGTTVTVEAEFAVGEYDIVILSATESNGLDQWLRANDYNIPDGAEPLLRPYVEQGMKFFVAKVDPTKVTFGGNGRARLSPLRFHYDSDEFALPVRLGLINAPDSPGGKQDLLVHILAPRTRYQVANYPNVTIPTNLDVRDSVRDHFGEFYVSLFDHTLAQNPGAVVTEYAWAASNCDPCPGPEAALTNQELLELGGDVLPNWEESLSKMASGPPRVRQMKAEVEGSLDKDIIRRIVRAHINEVRACFSASSVAAQTGELMVEFEISQSGKVTRAEVDADASTLKDEKLDRCITKAFKRWKFPKPREGVVSVRYPFSFAATGGPTSFGSPSPFVLTRLHARYDASALGEDLVFETAPAILGGREFVGRDGALERGAVETDGVNNFQARYAIRHPWQGAIECEDPVRDRWGEPPEGAPAPTVAKQLAQAKRGTSLGSFITAGAGQILGVATDASPEAGSADSAGADAPHTPDRSGEGEAQADADAKPTKDASAADESPGEPDSCACSTNPEPAVGLLALLGLLGLRRRRCD